MKKLLTLLILVSFSVFYGQLNHEIQAKYTEDITYFRFDNAPNLVVSDPSERIYTENSTIYVEKEFERKYKYGSTKLFQGESQIAAKAGEAFLGVTFRVFEKII